MLDFKRADFNKLREVVGKVECLDRAQDNEVQEGQQLVKDMALEAQQEAILTLWKDRRTTEDSAGYTRSFLAVLKLKEKQPVNGKKGKSLRLYTKEQQQLAGRNKEGKKIYNCQGILKTGGIGSIVWTKKKN